jgi:hypothetical protein
VKRNLLFLTVSLLVILIVATASGVILIRSEAGSRYLVWKTIDHFEMPLKIGRCQGNLLDGLFLVDTEYIHDRQRVSVEKAEIKLSLLSLLKGKLFLPDVKLKGVDYASNGQFDTIVKDFFALLNGTPRVSVIVGNAIVDGVAFHTQDWQHEIDNMLLSLSIDKDTLDITQLELKEDHLEVNLHGRASLIAPYSFQAETRWNLHRAEKKTYKGKWHIQGDTDTIRFEHQLYTPLYVRAGGEITLNRISPGQYKLDGNGHIDGQHLPQIHIQASGQGGLADFDLKAFQVQTLGGVVNANGHIAFKPRPKWRLLIDGKDINPGAHWTLWSGKLNVDTEIEGALVDGSPLLRMNEITISGDLLDQPFHASGTLGLDTDVVALKTLKVKSGNNQWWLNGTLSQNSNLRVDFDVPDPVKLWTGVHGHMAGNWVVKGDPRSPVGTMTLEGTDMRYGEYHLQKVNGTARVDLGNTMQSEGYFELHEFRVGEQSFSDISLKWDGDFQKHRVNVDVISPSTTMNIGFTGSCVKDNCEINVDAASFTLQQYGPWQLLNPVQLRVGPGEIKPFRSCWVQEQSDICLSSSWNDSDGWKTEGDPRAPALDALLEILKDVLNKEHLGWNHLAGK